MKNALIFFIVLFSTLVHAQIKDPNAEVKAMGLSETRISTLCGIAQSRGENFRDWKVTPIEEYMLRLERIMFTGSPEDYKKLGEAWINKYSKCFCQQSGARGYYGPLDALAILNEYYDWVLAFYDPDHHYKLNPNRLIWVDQAINKTGTLLDYLIYIKDERPIRAVSDEGRKRAFDELEEQLREYGANRWDEMSSQEKNESIKIYGMPMIGYKNE